MRGSSIVYLATVILLSACGASRPVAVLHDEASQTTQRPAWVSNRPSSSLYYIGIGRARKSGSPEGYEALARKNGLSDMAGEIEVKVSSSSFLYSLEHDERFSETYSQSISTSSELDLEGFEVFDTYSGQDYYYVYYRLSKSHYREVMAQRKIESLSRAGQHFTAAKAARESKDVGLAANYYVEVLAELRPYWGERNNAEVDLGVGQLKPIELDKQALEELMQLRADFHLSMEDQAIVLDIDNDFHKSIVVDAMLGDALCKPVTFFTRLDRESIESQEIKSLRKTFNANSAMRQEFSITADPFTETRRKAKAAGLSFLEEQLKPEVLHFDIETRFPDVSIVARQQGLDGGFGASPILKAALIRELSKIGIAVDDSGQSPYLIEVDALSRDGGVAQGFQVVYMDMTVTAKNTDTGAINYSQDFNSIKGVHRDVMNAGNVAIGKCGERITKNLMEPLIEALF